MMRIALCRRLAVASIALFALPAYAAKVEFFDDIETGPQQLGIEEHRYLAFGEVMYDYYRHANFDAINTLLVNQQNALFDESTEYAELLLGNLYVTYGLPHNAETIFNRLLEKDILTRTRAQTWLHKAALHYREGNLVDAAMILDGDQIRGLEPEDESRRRLMLANILMREGDFTGALDYLQSVPLDTDEGRYATYNTGVALIRANHAEQGVALLKSLLASGGESDQALALRDRAALAAGLTELKAGNLDSARADLRQIRSDGPFSEDALLALGLTNYRAGQVKRALPLWLEAVRRNSSHPSVQEALLLAPRAYEELGGFPQALAGYQHAARQYRMAMIDIQRAIKNIQKDGWAEALLPEDLNVTGLLTEDSTALAFGSELPYLYKLFSSNTFAQRYEHYRQIHQIKTMLESWQRSLPALQQTYQQQRSQLAQNLPHVRATVAQKITEQERLYIASDTLGQAIPSYIDLTHPEDLGSAEQSIMWQKVDRLTKGFGQLPGSTHNNALRLRRVRGLLLWDIAHQSEEQREQQQQAASALQEENRILEERIAAIKQQIRDATLRTRDDLGQRLAEQSQRIESLLALTEDTLAALEASMQQDALMILTANQTKLADQLAEAHLSAARLQDNSAAGSQ